MRESSIGYAIKIEPTEAELNLLARLRQLHGVYPYDADSQTLWVNGKPEYMRGRGHIELTKYPLPAIACNECGHLCAYKKSMDTDCAIWLECSGCGKKYNVSNVSSIAPILNTA